MHVDKILSSTIAPNDFSHWKLYLRLILTTEGVGKGVCITALAYKGKGDA